MRALYAGSFNPITNGHIDIIKQAVQLFETVIVGITNNTKKKYMLLGAERANLVYASLEEHNLIDSCQVKIYDGLTAIAADTFKVDILIRGLRAVSDFDAEFQMTQFNRKIHKGCNTMFLMPEDKNFYLSSSVIRDIYINYADIAPFVPNAVSKGLQRLVSQRRNFVVISAKPLK